MSAMVSQITSISNVYRSVCSDADQRKHQSPRSLAFVRGIHRWPVNSPHERPVTRKIFPFDDVIMEPDSIPHRTYSKTRLQYLTISQIALSLLQLTSCTIGWNSLFWRRCLIILCVVNVFGSRRVSCKTSSYQYRELRRYNRLISTMRFRYWLDDILILNGDPVLQLNASLTYISYWGG